MDRTPKDGRKPTSWTPAIEGLEGRALMAMVGPPVRAPIVPAQATLTPSDVNILLSRAAAAAASDDAIVAVVDRGGNILGVRVEAGVSPAITGNIETLVFAIDGAVAEARTGAFFGNDAAPLTSRTIQDISQSTITQREVQSNPNIPDPSSAARGPGFVSPIGKKAHFPARVRYTPQVDLFQIEHTNRDSIVSPGPNHVREDVLAGGAVKPGGDDVALPNRFNVPGQFLYTDPTTGKSLYVNAPESYGFVSGLLPAAQSRGIGTLPGGVPLVKGGKVVGGIGVFFPGTTGFASEENSKLNESRFRDPSKPDRAEQAEFIAFVAAGGSKGAGASFNPPSKQARLALPALDKAFDLPFGRIDLVGITLDIFGGGGRQGPKNLVDYGLTLGQGDPNSGVNMPIAIGQPPVAASSLANNGQGTTLPQGWLVAPHDAQDGSGLTAADVTSIIQRGVVEANIVRAAIRLPLDNTAKMMIAVSDKSGNILGLFRMPDATFFSIDVAVAKARNVAYYADRDQLQPQDRVANVPIGTAFTNRTVRYLAEPRFPEGIDGNPPGPFSILNETTLKNGASGKPASSFQTVQGFDSFNPQTNFHQPFNLNQNGIVFFPGSAPLYKNVNGRKQLVGGLGVSGDGVDQDDVVTFAASNGFSTGGTPFRRSDQVTFRGARLPYQKFNRQPHVPIQQKPARFPEELPGGVIKILPRKLSKPGTNT